jgi:predicted RNase H-like nuclease (RuvC/YqgF family)
MFGIFKKKEAPKPAPDPAAEQAAKRVQDQMTIAELQSQISELRRQSGQMNAELAQKAEERAALMAKIAQVPPAQKTALALRVKNIDAYVQRVNGNLALIEQQIGNNEAVITQIKAKDVVNTGDVGGVLNVQELQKGLQEAIEKKSNGDMQVQIADSMAADLTGDVSSFAADSALADILAEAEGSGQAAASSSTVSTSDAAQLARPVSASQF